MKLYIVLVTLSFAALANAGTSMHNPHYCFAEDRTKPQANMLAAANSYESIRRIDFSTVNPFATLNRNNRTPSRLWYLGRYGIRVHLTPALENMLDFVQIIPDIVRNYEAGLTTLCQRDFENIRNFTIDPDFVLENAGLLRTSGILELQNIAERFQQTFPDILQGQYSPSQYHFRHVDIARSNQSIRAFATGLFGQVGADQVVYEPIPQVDWLLRPFGDCPLYTAELEESNNYEMLAFINGPEIQQMVREVNEKLGFRGTNQLNHEQIDVMWDWCRYSFANEFSTGVHSPWCAPFSVAHVQLLVYLEDLQYYYRTGYGFRNRRLQENLNCGLFQDLVRHMRSNDESDQKARVFFTFLQEMHAFLVGFGAFRDVWELNQYNYAQQADRNWMMSLFTAFGTNIAVVRYDSEDGDHDLVFLLNERPLLIPGCDVQTGICKLSFLEERLERFIDANCAELFCSND